MKENRIITINSAGADMRGIVRPVIIEVQVSKGIGIHLVGLADEAVKESLLRVITAIQSLGYVIPGKKIVINLAPADLHKKGGYYDLPIALGILIASGQISVSDDLLKRCLFSGRLGLDGWLGINQENNGVGIGVAAQKLDYNGKKALVTSVDCAIDAGTLGWIFPYGFDNLAQVIEALTTENKENNEKFLIWNRKEWHQIEDRIDDNRNTELPL